MVYVYVDSLRMAYIQNELGAHTLSNPDDLKQGDTIIFPILKKNQRKLTLKKGTLYLPALENYTLFLPFPYSFIKENNNVYYYMRDDELVSENAKLTAAGLLSYIGSLPVAIKDTHIDIIGYGKCGRAIAKVFEAMELNIRVVRRANEAGKADEHENDTSICTVDEYKSAKKGNIIINTAPCNYLSIQDYENSEVNYLIDISSEKCFKEDDLPAGCTLIYPGSLPNQYFAYSSAALIADYVKGR